MLYFFIVFFSWIFCRIQIFVANVLLIRHHLPKQIMRRQRAFVLVNGKDKVH